MAACTLGAQAGEPTQCPAVGAAPAPPPVQHAGRCWWGCCITVGTCRHQALLGSGSSVRKTAEPTGFLLPYLASESHHRGQVQADFTTLGSQNILEGGFSGFMGTAGLQFLTESASLLGRVAGASALNQGSSLSWSHQGGGWFLKLSPQQQPSSVPRASAEPRSLDRAGGRALSLYLGPDM